MSEVCVFRCAYDGGWADRLFIAVPAHFGSERVRREVECKNPVTVLEITEVARYDNVSAFMRDVHGAGVSRYCGRQPIIIDASLLKAEEVF